MSTGISSNIRNAAEWLIYNQKLFSLLLTEFSVWSDVKMSFWSIFWLVYILSSHRSAKLNYTTALSHRLSERHLRLKNVVFERKSLKVVNSDEGEKMWSPEEVDHSMCRIWMLIYWWYENDWLSLIREAVWSLYCKWQKALIVLVLVWTFR